MAENESLDVIEWITEKLKPLKDNTYHIKFQIEQSLQNALKVFGVFEFESKFLPLASDFVPQNICSYLGDFNGDGITDYAYIQCMTPYLKDKVSGTQFPQLIICLQNRERLASSKDCFRAVSDIMQNDNGIDLNKMPDFNGDGLTDFVSFVKPDAIQVHLNQLPKKVNDLVFKQDLDSHQLKNLRVDSFMCTKYPG